MIFPDKPEKKSTKRPDNPVITKIGGIEIRKVNYVKIKLSDVEMLRLVAVHEQTGMSLSRILAMQGRSCTKCGNDNITIPREILNLTGRQ